MQQTTNIDLNPTTINLFTLIFVDSDYFFLSRRLYIILVKGITGSLISWNRVISVSGFAALGFKSRRRRWRRNLPKIN